MKGTLDLGRYISSSYFGGLMSYTDADWILGYLPSIIVYSLVIILSNGPLSNNQHCRDPAPKLNIVVLLMLKRNLLAS